MMELKKSFAIFISPIEIMKVGSEVSVLLFLIYRATLLLVYARTIEVNDGIDNDIETIVLSKIKAIKEVNSIAVDVNDVKFLLYTFTNDNDTNYRKPEGDIFFLMHGWSQTAESCPWYKPLTHILLNKYPTAQVVQVDLGKAVAGEYENAVSISESVGLNIAHMIHEMVKEGSSVEQIVLIGHSLGGQVAGFAGKKYRSLTNTSLSRIIALDPAAPSFDKREDTKRLNKHDADVVFVIHSDIKQFGFPTNCGTIDFYPNGGSDQPGCPKLHFKDSSSPETEKAVWCNHRRAKDIFIAAINNTQNFIATQCDSNENYKNHKCDKNQKVSMGDWKTNAMGSYYLEITEEVPFIN